MNIDSSSTVYINELNEVGPTDNLIIYYQMNNYLIDSSSNKNSGTNYGATVTDWIYGKSLLFNGTDNYTSTTISNSLITGDFSISFLAKYISLFGVNTIFRFGTLNSNGIFTQSNSNSATHNLLWNRSGASEIAGSFTLSTDIQHFLINYVNSSKSYSIYTNGTLTSNGVLTNQPIFGQTILNLGAYDSVTQLTNCQMSNFRIYNKSLSSSEISMLYKLLN